MYVLVAGLSACSFAQDDHRSGERRGHQGPPAFSELDLDQSGGISLEEFEQHEVPGGDHQRIFTLIDADSDGVITESELTNHKPPRHGRPKPEA